MVVLLLVVCLAGEPKDNSQFVVVKTQICSCWYCDSLWQFVESGVTKNKKKIKKEELMPQGGINFCYSLTAVGFFEI